MTDASSEQYRHECEVRFVADMPSRQMRSDYIAGVERQRGKDAADRLRLGVQEIFDARRRAVA